MLYALVISFATGLALLGLLGGAGLLVRRAAGGDVSLRGWRWYPNTLGITVALVLVAAIAWRFFPVFLFIPIVLPFVFRRVGRGRRDRRPNESDSNGHGPIEGRYRDGM